MESFIIQFKKLARRIDVTRIKIVINKFNKINFKSNKSNVLTFTKTGTFNVYIDNTTYIVRVVEVV
jgi:CO dehydrogenase nickel-insertion accessory protein CooC1